MNKSKIIISLLLLLVFIGRFIPSSFAQLADLSISPPLIEMAIKPGKVVLIAYTLHNFGDPTVITTKVLPFEPKDSNGNIKIKEEFEGPIRFSLDNNDIQLDKPFFLRTKTSQQLLLRMRVPEGAPAGDYYYTFISETQAPPSLDGNTSPRSKVAIGSNILITVTSDGNIEVKGRISKFNVIPHFTLPKIFNNLTIFDVGDKIPIILTLENTGNNLIKPYGNIIMKGSFGEIATYDLIPQNILAHSQRTILATPSAMIDCQDDKNMRLCKASNTLTLAGFFLGNYKLSTTINFGENTGILNASTSFLVFPVKLTIGLAIMFLILYLIFRKVRSTESET
ncbi:MAG: hypothetical protein Q7S61_05785 [bacterium]|nr:hypothetical protein [bacterium]